MQSGDNEKPPVSPVPVWRCRSSDCKAWIREELAGTERPECPLCKGEMIRGMKLLPKLVKKHKAAKKKPAEDSWL